jgi:hypothetical protein
MCGCILGSVLVVLGWRYWAGGRPGRVGTVTRGRVEAVAAGSDCWVGCGGLYELGCRSFLALVNEEGKASGACADRACAGGTCVDGACTGGAYTDEACADGACGPIASSSWVGCWAGWECDIVYGKGPAGVPPGNGGFVYIEGPIRPEILLSLKEVKNLLALM